MNNYTNTLTEDHMENKNFQIINENEVLVRLSRRDIAHLISVLEARPMSADGSFWELENFVTDYRFETFDDSEYSELKQKLTVEPYERPYSKR